MMAERQSVITDGREAYQMSNNGTWSYCKHIIASMELYIIESDKEILSTTLSLNTLLGNVSRKGIYEILPSVKFLALSEFFYMFFEEFT